MVRPCAKHARQNCCAPTKNTDGKTPSDIFMSACPHPSPLGLYGLGCGSNNDSYAPTNRFWTHSCSPPLGCLLAWFYAVTEDKRAMSARFHNVAEGNISRLRDAQVFHAAVKRPPYFMFARQRRHFTAGRGLPGCPRPWAYII